MTTPPAYTTDHQILRNAIGNLELGAAHRANDPPAPEQIFAPAAHSNALDPQRPLVIGNRGVGKSFWSSVLTHEATRERVALKYPRLPLARIRASLGFHEAAGKDDGPAPSPAVLGKLREQGHEPEKIWRAVLLNAVREHVGEDTPASLSDTLLWMQTDLARAEAALRGADRSFLDNGQTFLLVFDALDRLGKNWADITPLTEGILRLALDMRGFRALGAKVFMRSDQYKDQSLFRFADASKIKSNAVTLVWRRSELFGLLYNNLLQHDAASAALFRLARHYAAPDLGRELLENEGLQEWLFYRLAGEFMGTGPKRGRTYNWLYDHLADTSGETSPRSFITALQRAANFSPAPSQSAIDYSGIRAGVQDASRVRVTELKEDYDWIDKVIGALNGLAVPCDPSVFKNRWRERGTIADLESNAADATSRLPLELLATGDKGDALLMALKNIGVVEFRTPDRINMPDIFRVEAGIKRRGGVRPPSSKRI